MTSEIRTHVHRAGLLVVSILLGACAAVPPPAPLPEPVAEVEPVPEKPVMAAVKHRPRPTPTIVEPPRDPVNVAIVLSSRQPAYLNVSHALVGHFEKHAVYDLSNPAQPPVSVFRSIADSEAEVVVAVGLRAATSASSMAEVPVIFCQVFNYQDNELLSDTSRGVSAMPPLDLQIAAWKKIDPGLKRIGAIVGEGQDELLAEAEIAAAENDVELLVQIARSDRQTQYMFNRLVGQIDGFWLFPDNRVLSPGVLRHILHYAARRGVQVAVFNESILAMGAAVSSTAVDSDIAATIARLVEQIDQGQIAKLPPLSALSEIRVTTNERVMEKIQATESTQLENVNAQVEN